MNKQKKILIPAVFFLITAVSLICFKYFFQTDPAQNNNLKVSYIDVEQGDCTLIESEGSYMLIDAGKETESDKITNYLKTQGVKKLDYVIWTHPDADHIGGGADIINTFPIGKVLMSSKTHTTQTFENLLLAIKENNLSITLPEIGAAYQLGAASFTIIAPNREYEDNNNSSVGIKLVNGNNSFLFIGDAKEEAIDDILDNSISLKADVYMAGHHGSDTSTSKELINAIDPEFAVISVGKDNSYGHPSKSTLQLLNKKGIKIYRTDENGTIVAVSDGKQVTINAKAYEYKESSETPREITVYITKSGKKYHQADCPYISSGKTAIPLKEAAEIGLTPCSKCNPPQ